MNLNIISIIYESESNSGGDVVLEDVVVMVEVERGGRGWDWDKQLVKSRQAC